MVHALREAHRVLKVEGLLIDLRPAPKHRRVGIVASGTWHSVGRMHEDFEDDVAANRAVTRVLAEGLFSRMSQREFDVDRVVDTPDEFRGWLEDSVTRGTLPRHEWLMELVERAWGEMAKGSRIAIRGPLMLAVYRKVAA